MGKYKYLKKAAGITQRECPWYSVVIYLENDSDEVRTRVIDRGNGLRGLECRAVIYTDRPMSMKEIEEALNASICRNGECVKIKYRWY